MLQLSDKRNVLQIIILEIICARYNIPLYRNYNYDINKETSCDIMISKSPNEVPCMGMVLLNAKRQPLNLISTSGYINIYQCSIIDAIKVIRNKYKTTD